MIGNEPTGVIAVFTTAEDADRAVEALRSQGFDMRSVSVLGPGQPGGTVPPELDSSRRHSIEVARYWGRWGAIVGAAAGAGVVAIPVVVATVGVGPFAPVLAAIVAGSTGFGALASALAGYGVHEKHALDYEHALRASKTIVVAHADELADLQTAKDALLSAKPERVDTHGLVKIEG